MKWLIKRVAQYILKSTNFKTILEDIIHQTVDIESIVERTIDRHIESYIKGSETRSLINDSIERNISERNFDDEFTEFVEKYHDIDGMMDKWLKDVGAKEILENSISDEIDKYDIDEKIREVIREAIINSR